jgi:diketogulonate reductase-like aldo/keto reductase
MKSSLRSTLKMNNGVEIPVLGLGVFRSPPGQKTRQAVLDALAVGYRHVDTAHIYGNERDVGEAIRRSELPRKNIFVTTKLWNSDHGYDRALRAFDRSATELGLDYVDLYLIHWPVEGLRQETWRALESLYRGQRCRAIGVSNYTISHLSELLDSCEVVPAINQVEFHPFLYQRELLDFCERKEIALEAYSPLAKAKKLADPTLVRLAEKYQKTPAQVLIRWSLQHGLVVIPKSIRKERIEENADVFNFALATADMQLLDALDRGLRTAWDPTHAP